MLNTSSRVNFKPAVEIDDLDALAKEVCKHLQASATAAQNFLEHALAAGDALIRAKAQVKHGEWLPWLKSCGLGEDTAERYMKLARHRAELNSARVRNLSLSAALKLIAKPKKITQPTAKHAPADDSSDDVLIEAFIHARAALGHLIEVAAPESNWQAELKGKESPWRRKKAREGFVWRMQFDYDLLDSLISEAIPLKLATDDEAASTTTTSANFVALLTFSGTRT